jgi:hypothetical protein
LVHLDSFSKPASAAYDRPAEPRPAAAFDSVRRYGSLLQSRGTSGAIVSVLVCGSPAGGNMRAEQGAGRAEKICLT